jgi:dTDP-4-dehydrorhamnose reductase
MRWLITGSRGQLGQSLERCLKAQGGEALAAAFDHRGLDIADRAAVRAALDGARAEVVANAAAFTWVDRCEREPAEAWRANAEGPGILAEECAARGMRFVHVSTDYVFDGQGKRPYTEEDPPAPASEYGRSKLEGERRVRAALPDALVVRTSWLFGPGRNFVATILGFASARREAGDTTPLSVVDDQFGSPTYAADLASWCVALVEGGAAGTYHLANRGVATWWEVAREALDLAGFEDIGIDRVGTDRFPRPAPRPPFSALDGSKADGAGIVRRGWREALAAYIDSSDSPLKKVGEHR